MALYGIDLGTTFSCAAYLDGAHPRIVPLGANGSMPTLVVLDAAPEPHAFVGEAARQALRGGPHETATLIRNAKNFLGVRMRVPGGPPWMLAERELYATDIAAIVLRAIADAIRADATLPPLDGVVITHPQRFRNTEKLATAQAARLAGLELVGLLTEPDAAAWAYGLHERSGPEGPFMVFDFGGGTLDVTLMRRHRTERGETSLTALGSYGVQLGGLQLDEIVRDRLFDALPNAPPFEELSERSRERLLDAVEQLKIDLNVGAGDDPSPMLRSRTRVVRVDDVDGTPRGELRLKLTLGELSSWIAGEIDRALACADHALERSALRWGDLQEVLLTGGSSQLWPLRQRLRERCAGRPVRVFDDPDHPLRPGTIVAVGAAIYGAARVRQDPSLRIDVRGVVPDAFSVRAYVSDPDHARGRRPVLQTLVAAGVHTPHEAVVQFRMRGEGRVLPLELFEGEREQDATPIGTFRIELEREVPDGAPIDVRLRVDANGALSLSVRDPTTGARRDVAVDDAPGLYSDAELDDRRNLLQKMQIRR